MSLSELVNRLRQIEAGDPVLDQALLDVLGFKEDVGGNVLSSRRGHQKAWLPPNGGEAIISPRCTFLIEDACKVAATLIGGRLSGVSWEGGAASAQVEGGPFLEAKTPQAAICLALLHDLASAGRISTSTPTHSADQDGDGNAN